MPLLGGQLAQEIRFDPRRVLLTFLNFLRQVSAGASALSFTFPKLFLHRAKLFMIRFGFLLVLTHLSMHERLNTLADGMGLPAHLGDLVVVPCLHDDVLLILALALKSSGMGF